MYIFFTKTTFLGVRQTILCPLIFILLCMLDFYLTVEMDEISKKVHQHLIFVKNVVAFLSSRRKY